MLINMMIMEKPINGRWVEQMENCTYNLDQNAFICSMLKIDTAKCKCANDVPENRKKKGNSLVRLLFSALISLAPSAFIFHGKRTRVDLWSLFEMRNLVMRKSKYTNLFLYKRPFDRWIFERIAKFNIQICVDNHKIQHFHFRPEGNMIVRVCVLPFRKYPCTLHPLHAR